MIYNATVDANKVVYIYPLSGSYGVLQRANFYVLTAILLITFKWSSILAQGAAATVMISAGVAAVHAVLLAMDAKSDGPAFDMDIIGCWCLVSVAALFLLPFATFSRVARNSGMLSIIRLWGFLVGVGAICAWIAALKGAHASYPCVDVLTNEPLRKLPTLGNEANCTPACFQSHQLLRAPDELQLVDMYQIFGESYARSTIYIGFITIFGTVYGLLGVCCNWDMRKLQKDMSRDSRRWKARGNLSLITAVYVYGHPFLLVATMTCNEVYLGSPGLPTGEAPWAIGQWSCWVAMILAFVAQLVAMGTKSGRSGPAARGGPGEERCSPEVHPLQNVVAEGEDQMKAYPASPRDNQPREVTASRGRNASVPSLQRRSTGMVGLATNARSEGTW